jgi:hypothetical protein
MIEATASHPKLPQVNASDFFFHKMAWHKDVSMATPSNIPN